METDRSFMKFHRSPLFFRTTFPTGYAALVVLMLLGGSPSGQAAAEVAAVSYTNPQPSSQNWSTSSTGTVTSMQRYEHVPGKVDASSSASFGVLRASSSASAGTEGGFFTDYNVVWTSTSYARFQDNFLIDAPGLTGTAGTVTVRFTINGTLAATALGSQTNNARPDENFAYARYIFGLDPSDPNSGSENVVMKTEIARVQDIHEGSAFLNIPQEFTLNFIYGTVLPNVTLEISTYATARSQMFVFGADVSADLSHTALWDGFTSVRDAGGNPVSNYTFSSGSGVDYVQPIPEPGTLVLLLAGGAVLGGLWIHRRLGVTNR